MGERKRERANEEEMVSKERSKIDVTVAGRKVEEDSKYLYIVNSCQGTARQGAP